MSWLPPSLDNTTTCQHAIASMPATGVAPTLGLASGLGKARQGLYNQFRMQTHYIYRMHHGRRSGCINLRRHAAAASAHELGARGCTNTAIYRCALRKRLRLRRRHYHIHQHHRHPYIITMQQHLRAHHRHRYISSPAASSSSSSS